MERGSEKARETFYIGDSLAVSEYYFYYYNIYILLLQDTRPAASPPAAEPHGISSWDDFGSTDGAGSLPLQPFRDTLLTKAMHTREHDGIGHWFIADRAVRTPCLL